jgi:hypothetical protein
MRPQPQETKDMDANTQREIDRLNGIANRARKACGRSASFQIEQAAAMHEFNASPTTDGGLARLAGRIIRNVARLAGMEA